MGKENAMPGLLEAPRPSLLSSPFSSPKTQGVNKNESVLSILSCSVKNEI